MCLFIYEIQEWNIKHVRIDLLEEPVDEQTEFFDNRVVQDHLSDVLYILRILKLLGALSHQYQGMLDLV